MYLKQTLVYNYWSPNSPRTIINNEFNNETAANLWYFTGTKSPCPIHYQKMKVKFCTSGMLTLFF